MNDNFAAVATAINAAASSNTALSNAVQSLQTAQIAGFAFRGAWSAAFIYGVNDVVSRNGSSYVALAGNAGVDPALDLALSGGRWGLIAQKGTDGATGVAGVAGAPGAPGAMGLPGATGPAGAAGLSGPVGASGATGPAGAAGVAGPPGPAGATGAVGAAGATGAPGATGPIGPAGPVGPAGAAGAMGPAGSQGPVGPMGAAGATGVAGATGSAGAPGAAGSQGPAGPTGATGARGADGNDGADGIGLKYTDDKTGVGAGPGALSDNKDGVHNTATGTESLYSNVSGNDNTALGFQSLRILSGSNNIALGSQAGAKLNKGDSNIYLGNAGAEAEDGTIRIGTDGDQARTFISGIYGASPEAKTSAAVVVDENGQLGTVSSSRRYKFDIQPMADSSNDVLKLRPVTFRYRKASADGSHPAQFGLIAEEVAEVMPQLVVYNRAGEPDSVAYHLLPALLLNEMQKQRELIAQLEARLATLEAASSHKAP